MSAKLQTPLTLEVFEEAILPRLEEMMDERLEAKLKPFRDDVLGFKVEVMGEIKDLREEVTVALHQYKRTNKRVDGLEVRVDKLEGRV